MEDEILFDKKNGGYHYRIYHNRVEIDTPVLFSKRTDVIFIKNIAKLDTRGIGSFLYIIDTGGKEEKIILHPKDAKKFREIIISLMP